MVGDSGGGKSSLINTLIRFYDVNNGAILINGINIKDYSLQSLRDTISIVTQRVYIFNDTIGANIAYGQSYDKQKIKEALIQAHALDFVNNMPNGIDTILDESGTNLSGGQRQRIAIARALYKQPQILILDEATSSVDTQTELHLQHAIDIVLQNRTSIVIAHRLSTITKADRIIVLDKGQIVEMGTHATLIAQKGEYFRLYTNQFKEEQIQKSVKYEGLTL